MAAAILSLTAVSDTRADDLARAQLDLARAHRERSARKAESGCLEDLATARALAHQTGKPLLVWVPGCEPKTRAALPDCVHVHQASWLSDTTPRVILTTPAGDWSLPRAQISADNVRRSLLSKLRPRADAGGPAEVQTSAPDPSPRPVWTTPRGRGC